MRTREAYPILVKENSGTYLVFVPDWEIYTEGDSMADAISMARDAIGAKWLDFADDRKDIPKASSYAEAVKKAEADADEDFDYSDGILTYADVDFEQYKARIRNRAVKKNCTIPFWLNEEAEARGINFSKVLQEALIQAVRA